MENYGIVMSPFSFSPSNSDGLICKPWLQIVPYSGILAPGEAIEIKIQLLVTPIHARETNFEGIEDILILHVENGKDLFISINGEWKVSILGNSISVLCTQSGPISELSREKCKVRLLSSVQDQNHHIQHLPTPTQTSSIPKEIWRLIDFIFRYGLVIVDKYLFFYHSILTTFL